MDMLSEHQTTQQTVKPFPAMKLCPELRLQVYHHVFADPSQRCHRHPLTEASSILRSESLPIYHQQLVVTISCLLKDTSLQAEPHFLLTTYRRPRVHCDKYFLSNPDESSCHVRRKVQPDFLRRLRNLVIHVNVAHSFLTARITFRCGRQPSIDICAWSDRVTSKGWLSVSSSTDGRDMVRLINGKTDEKFKGVLSKINELRNASTAGDDDHCSLAWIRRFIVGLEQDYGRLVPEGGL